MYCFLCATFETTEDHLTFLIHIPSHIECRSKVLLNDAQDVTKELSERQFVILKMIVDNSSITITEMSQKIGVVTRTVKRELAILKDKGYIIRKGGRKDGCWEILK